jgi:flagellar biosynthesis/type III secretory pathway protein FliH
LFAVARDTTIPEHLRIDAIRSTYMLDEARSHFSEHPIWHDLLAELDRQTPRILAEQRADAVKEGVAQGVAQGIEQGVAQGVDKAIEDLLAAAAAHLPPDVIEKLRLQRDPVAIALAMAGAAR